MKRLFLVFWLVLPLGLVAWHYGPGQDALRRDDSARWLKRALAAEKACDPAAAIENYTAALDALPGNAVAENRRIRLARARARMLARELPTAERELGDLFREIESDRHAEADVARETRASLAASKYYMTWLLRLEGLPEEEWEPEIEAARQHFRHLAEDAAKRGDPTLVKQSQESLESSIKLARMDLTELQGLPLPKQ
jgi:hypothetical protein